MLLAVMLFPFARRTTLETCCAKLDDTVSTEKTHGRTFDRGARSGGVAYVAMETKEMKLERTDLLKDLARVTQESDAWRNAARTHIDGLSRAIADQFKMWRLSESETDIALLMLKGLTFREIANLRGSEETTVRQQATAVYRKSGLASRAELGAFFLEDLLAPSAHPEAPHHVTLVHSLK